MFIKNINDTIHCIGTLAAVDGVTTQPTHQPAQWRDKQTVLPKKTDIDAQGIAHQDAHREIPVGGMGRNSDQGFLGEIGGLTGNFPTPHFQNPLTNNSNHAFFRVQYPKKYLFCYVIRFFILLTFLFPVIHASSQEVNFSLEGGWYEGDVNLWLSDSGGTIYYTTNGNTARPGGAVFRDTLRLTSTTVVRAITCKDGMCSRERAHTYFIREPKSRFPVVSVALPADALFNADYGLYREGPDANQAHWKRQGANYWSKKEMLSYLNFYESNGEPAFSGNMGFRIFGGMSRTMPQKSFSMTARKRYGQKRLKHHVFGPDNAQKFKSLVFRNGGSDFGKSHFRDGLMTSLVKGWDIEMQDHRPAHVYLNGRYWGIYNIREKINRFFIEDQSGFSRDSIDLLEQNMLIKIGSAANYKRMIDYISRHDMAVDSHFHRVGTMMDIDNFMHYQIAQIYYDNKEAWGNIRFWRPHRPDGRWRWILYDVDQGFGLHDPLAYMANTLAMHTDAHGPSWPNPPWSTFLLRKLLENPDFKHKFITHFFDALNEEFNGESVVKQIEEFAALYKDEIPRQWARWRGSKESWDEQVSIMKQFGQKRPKYLRQFLIAEFGLGAETALCLEATEGGTLTINQHIFMEDESRTFYYAGGQSIHLSVTPKPGYRFVGWEGLTSKAWEQQIEIEGAVPNIKAVFESYRHPLADRVLINEIGPYNKASRDWIELYNATDSAVDVTSWILADRKNHYRLPTSVIPPRGYLVLCQDPKKFKSYYPGVPVAHAAFGFGLNKREEGIYLYSYDGAFVDSIGYTLPLTDSIFTLALLLPELDNALARNWTLQYGKGTPGAGNPQFVQSRIKARQDYWLRVGLGVGVLLLIIFFTSFRWSKKGAI